MLECKLRKFVEEKQRMNEFVGISVSFLPRHQELPEGIIPHLCEKAKYEAAASS